MGSAYRRYRKDSPEAVASVLAALLLGDGRLDPREIDFMDRVGVFGIVGVPRETFLRVASEAYAAMQGETVPAATQGARLDAALEAVRDRDLQLLVSAVLLYLAEADHAICEREVALVRQVFERWCVSAAELERGVGVPVARTRRILDAGRRTAT